MRRKCYDPFHILIPTRVNVGAEGVNIRNRNTVTLVRAQRDEAAVRVRGFLDNLQRVPRDEVETIPGPHQIYGFLTSAPNALVEPIHPKAMPVILTTNEQRDVWMRPSWMSQGSSATLSG